MLFDGFIGAIIGAIIGALITVAFSWWTSRSQRKEDRGAAAKRLTDDKEAAAKQQRNDIARAAHLLVVDFQSKVLRIAVESAARQNYPDVAKYIKQGVSDLITSLTDDKGIIAQLDQCCPKQKSQLINLEENALEAAPTVQVDAVKLFNVCMDLSNGLTSIRSDLADMIREV
jgi:gas vesicle protein